MLLPETEDVKTVANKNPGIWKEKNNKNNMQKVKIKLSFKVGISKAHTQQW